MKGEHAKMGMRLRELRLDRGLQQGEVARRLEISPAYLSLIEKGKRSVQLPLLFRALELYGVSMEDFMESLGERRVDDGLARLLDEPLLRSLNLSEEDVASLSAEPKMVTTITALFNLYKATRSQLDNVLQGLAEREREASSDSALRFELSPFDEVTDFLQQNGNYFPDLEEAAERARTDYDLGYRLSSDALIACLQDHFDVRVELAQAGQGGSSVVRRWDRERNVLTLSSEMYEQRLKFQLAHAIGLCLMDRGAFGVDADELDVRHQETHKLIKIHLANNFAGALLLPYEEFYEQVIRTRYDVELLANLFQSSYETVAHRLCNLGHPKRRGLPFHFVRVDVAGNISKSYSATGLRFPHQGGSCPKSCAHMAFLTPNVVRRQYEVHPDGTAYFSFAKVITETRQGSIARGAVYSIGLGTHADNAKHLAYADDRPFADPRRMSIPVGATCRFCERADCNQRAAPSYKFAFRVDEYTKKDNFFSPLTLSDQVRVGAGEPDVLSGDLVRDDK